MNILTAKNIIKTQVKNFRKLNNVRFIKGEREYRLNYDKNWFTPMICIYYREIGKRKFQYLSGVNVTHVMSTERAYDLCIKKIEEREMAE